MAAGDGNGWVQCRCGHRHWGVHGAAGLLLARPSAVEEQPEILLQLRSAWTHLGGTWGIPGGATDSHEDAATGALREAREEAGVEPTDVEVLGLLVPDDHGDWAYRVVVGRPRGPLSPYPANAESDELRWVGVHHVERLRLHPGFATTWDRVRDEMTLILAAADGPPARAG